MLRIVALLKLPRPHDPAQIAFYQGHTGALHGHIRSGSHRNADVGLRQGRRVIDAVACHGYDPSLRLEPS